MSTLKELENTDELHNPSARQANSLFNAEEKTGQDAGINAGIDQTERFANDSSNATKNIDAISQKESTSGSTPNQFNYSQGQKNQQKIDKARIISKKYGGIFGLISILGVGGGIMASFLGPASMLINLMENFTNANDSSSVAMERRFMKAFAKMTEPTDPACANSKKIKCKMGRISNSALKKLERKGITATFANDTTNTGKRTGYPSKNPTHYVVDLKDGSKPKTIKAADFAGFLANNPKVASKVLGRSGAFNLRVKAWTGKHISNKLYKRFSIDRNGGLADGKNGASGTSEEKLKRAQDKLKGTVASLDTDKASGDVRAKVDKHLGKAKKGGVAYTAAVAGCISVKAPSFIAAGVAGAQLAQIIPIYMNTIGSPASKAKANAVGGKFNSDDMNTIGTLLTEKTKNKDGKMTAATDSAIFQSALGVNKNKAAVSKDFIPGYSILTNPAIKTARKAEAKSEAACNGIMSPAAMYTAMAADAAVTVAASATIIGGIVKIAAGWALTKVATAVVGELLESGADKVISELAENDKIPTAKGEELGDAIGVSASAFYASGGMARTLPALKQSQLAAYEDIRTENEAFYRNMDLASLSPFDTSSKYTFLGSIVHNLQTTATINGGYNTSFMSLFSSFAKLPSLSLMSNAGAVTNLTSKSCGYAKEFNLEMDEENAKHTPAVSVSGLPCTGITGDQVTMDTDSAIDYLTSEGWIDESNEVNDNATIDDLMSDEIIKGDTPMTDFLENCTDPSSGEYIFNAATCTVNTGSNNIKNTQVRQEDACVTVGEEQQCASDAPGYEENTDGVKNPRSLAAITPLLLDYQIQQAINGEDEEETGNTATPVTGAASTFTVSSYNFCHEVNHENCKFTNKVENISNTIKGTSGVGNPVFDIVGAQEVSVPTLRSVKEKTGYEIFPEAKDLPSSNGRAILWDKNKFSQSESGWLKGVYGNGGNHGPGNQNDQFPWVKLTSTGGQAVYVISIHNPLDAYADPTGEIGGQSNRLNNATKIREWAESKTSDGSMVVVTGDFNQSGKKDGSNPTAYCVFTKGGFMQFAGDMAKNKNKNNECPSAHVPIDQVYATTNISGLKATSWSRVTKVGNKSGTDHSPAWATYTIPGTQGDSAGELTGELAWVVKKELWNTDPGIFKKAHSGCGTFTGGGCIDISFSGDDGAPVYAIAGGKVTKRPLGRSSYACTGSPNSPDNGGLMIESTIGGKILRTAYAHGYDVINKDTVATGEKIMKLGNVGNSCGSHLHIDMTYDEKPICPQDVFIAMGSNKTPNFEQLTKESIGTCGR